MSNYEEKPIQLINEKYELCKEGEDFIKSLGDKKITIITVIGPKSSGKSFLSNQLVGIFNNGFEIGSIQNTNESCTKGLWAWGKPLSQNGKEILILDPQGLSTETEEQTESSRKLLNLINSISANVIFNYKKDDESEENNEINEQVIKNSVDYFTKLIQNQNGKNIPNYFWVYRDYNINDTSKYIDIINSMANKSEDYNTKYKNKIKIFALPPPMEENDMLINLYIDEKENPFDDEYKQKIEEFRKIIFEEGTNTINGSQILKSIKNINKMNSGMQPSLSEEEIDKIGNEVIDQLKNKLKEKNENINDILIKCKNSYDILSDKILSSFNGENSENEYLMEKINNIINIYGKELIDNYLQNKISEYEEVLKNIIAQKENTSPLLNQINKKDDIKSFYDNFIEETTKDLNENLFNEKYQFFQFFPEIKTYLEKCIFNHFVKYITNINDFIKVSDDANKEINEQKEKIDNLNNELNNLKQNYESKEKEYLSNIETQKQSLEKLEQEKKELIEEKNNLTNKNTNLEKSNSEMEEKIKALESQLTEMNNKNQELTTKVNEYIEKENAKPKPLLLNIKDEDIPKLIPLLTQIQTTSKEFNDTIQNFLQKKSNVFHSQFIEETKSNTNKKCENWVEELKKITKERFENKDNYYANEIDKLKEDKNTLNEELNKIKNETEKIKDENNNLKEEIKLVKDIQTNLEKYKTEKEKIISTLKNTNEICEKRIKEFDTKINDMEYNLSNYKFESKMKEEEIDSTFNLFKSMLEKNKKNFENNLKKVPEYIKNDVLNLNKKYKFIKM